MWIPYNGIHIQLIMLIMPNTIENESENRVQTNKKEETWNMRNEMWNVNIFWLRISMDEFSADYLRWTTYWQARI